MPEAQLRGQMGTCNALMTPLTQISTESDALAEGYTIHARIHTHFTLYHAHLADGLSRNITRSWLAFPPCPALRPTIGRRQCSRSRRRKVDLVREGDGSRRHHAEVLCASPHEKNQWNLRTIYPIISQRENMRNYADWNLMT